MDRLTARLTSRYLSYGLPFLYLLTSIAFYLHTYDSAQVKITVVQMLGTFLVGLWYVQLACEGEIPMKDYLPIVAPLLAILASGVISFLHAAYRGPSLDECIRRVFYIHFALIAMKEINTIGRMKRFHTYLLIATAISVAYGFIEFLDSRFFPGGASGLDPFIWRQAFGPRIFSTFGNPNFFGNFLVILTPITLALLLKRNREKAVSVIGFALSAIFASALIWQSDKLFHLLHLDSWSVPLFTVLLLGYIFWTAIHFGLLGVLFFFITLCVLATESKGAWVGYSAGVIAFLMLVLFYFSQFQSDRLKRTIKFGAIATLIFSIFGVSLYLHMRPQSVRFRVCTWTSTWEMGLMHPLVGNGIGSFRILYPAFRRPQIFHIEGKHNTETDHAEDEYWEVFQDEGLIGFGIFIWGIVTFSFLGIRALERFTEGLSIRDPSSGKRKVADDPRAFYMLGLLSAFWGMLIHNGMDVSLRFVSSGIFLWMLAGLMASMVIHDPMPNDEAQLQAREPEGADAPEHPIGLQLVAGFITLGLFGSVTYLVITQFADSQGAFPDPFGEVLLWIISWISVLGTVGACVWMLYKIARSLKHIYGFVLLWLMIYPLFTFWGYFMADVHHNRGIFFSKQQQWDKALENYHTVVTLNPNYIMAYYFMGNVYTDRWRPGDVDRAMDAYKQAWAIAPNYVQSHHQAGLVYLKKGTDDKRLADQLHAQGKNAEAMQALQQTEDDWKQALYYFHKYHDIDPVFEPNYARMGWVDVQLADLERALGHAEAANKYDADAEAAYTESLQATMCRLPANDMMHEHWDRTHRHFSAEMFENEGNFRFMRGRFADAARAYKMSLWQDPTNVRVWKNLAYSYARLGQQGLVAQTWLHIRQLSPNDPDVLKAFQARPPQVH